VSDAPATAGPWAPVGAWWRGLAARDRRWLLLGGAVLAGYLVWSVAVQPAWRSIARTPAELDRLESQWQTMQRLAEEARLLRATPPVNPEAAAAALKAATERLGAKGRLALQGDRAVLTLNGAGTSELRDWLAEARSGARARPIEASLTRVGPGYSGTLVVAIGGGP
jgi:general secretion pathway protein M